MKKIIVFLFLSLLYVNGIAHAAEVIWSQYRISDLIDSEGEYVTTEKIDEQFKGRSVSIDDKMVSVTGLCHYEYTKTEMSPLKYWHSEKTVALYRQRLAENNIQLGDTLYRIIPRYPSTECSYPFSYFQQIGDELIFVVNNRMVIYSHDVKVPAVASGPICRNKDQTPEQVFDEGSIFECTYPNLSLVETYAMWRESLPENKEQIPEKLPAKDTKITCKEVCISVLYSWQGAEKLKVVEQFAGGETHTYFSQNPTETNVVTISYPD